ncbi:MAG: 2-C-methyl-D-erythritol 4-phosphate cytidylyltransferase [bacterium]
MHNCAIIVAAGKGSRFEGVKQFQLLRGIPILVYSILSFQKNKRINSIILAVPKNKIDFVKQLIKKFKLEKVKKVVTGGKRRQDSVLNGLAQVKTQQGIVLIHDGVRPLITQSLINKGIKLCKKYKAVIFGIPVGDTVKESRDHRVLRTVPRKNLFLIQTPQFYDVQLLKKTIKTALMSREYTDESAILEAQGIQVHLFQGQLNNIKITRKEDLRLIEKLL